ncbi:hypothetical protein LguiA_017320 [Lonicera macranthoides]
MCASDFRASNPACVCLPKHKRSVKIGNRLFSPLWPKLSPSTGASTSPEYPPGGH